MVYDIMNDKQRRLTKNSSDKAFVRDPELARFRVNAFNQNRGAGAVFRNIPRSSSRWMTWPPKIFRDLYMLPRGLVLVTGPTGSGQVHHARGHGEHCNDNRPIASLRRGPHRYVHEQTLPHEPAPEVHRDTLGFSALRSALRRPGRGPGRRNARPRDDPSRSPAETGHLVFGTLHEMARNVASTAWSTCSPPRKEMVRAMLQSRCARSFRRRCSAQRRWSHRGARDHDAPTIRNLIREARLHQRVLRHPDRWRGRHLTLDRYLAGPHHQGVSAGRGVAGY
jgi:twitching motility protein PilT